MKKKYLLGGAVLGIILELGVIGYETNEQKAIDYRVDQARAELSKKQTELKNLDSNIANSQRKIALKQGGNQEQLAEQEVAQAKAKKQVRKLFKLLYTRWGLKKNWNFHNHLGKSSFVICHSHHSPQTTAVALLAESQVHSFSSGVCFISFSAS